eukprot:645562-Hanusia_phi.AAC.3
MNFSCLPAARACPTSEEEGRRTGGAGKPELAQELLPLQPHERGEQGKMLLAERGVGVLAMNVERVAEGDGVHGVEQPAQLGRELGRMS